MSDETSAIIICNRCRTALVLMDCPNCEGSGVEWDEFGNCGRCRGTGLDWACPVCDVDEEAEEDIEPEPEPTRDELLQALREAWGDVINHRTHILHDFTDFFKDELGEE